LTYDEELRGFKHVYTNNFREFEDNHHKELKIQYELLEKMVDNSVQTSIQTAVQTSIQTSIQTAIQPLKTELLEKISNVEKIVGTTGTLLTDQMNLFNPSIGDDMRPENQEER